MVALPATTPGEVAVDVEAYSQKIRSIIFDVKGDDVEIRDGAGRIV